MYKIFSILLLVAVFSTAKGQEKHFIPKPLQVPGVDASSGMPNLSTRPSTIEIERLREFILSNSLNIHYLAPDNLPCLVPNKANISTIPNAFSSSERLPYMPNSIPLHKITASR